MSYRDVRHTVRTVRRVGAWSHRHSLLLLVIALLVVELISHAWPIMLAAGVAALVWWAGRRRHWRSR